MLLNLTLKAKFFVRGVAYQVNSTLDPISDDRLAELKNDILLFKELGLNTLFVCKRGSNRNCDEADSCVKTPLTVQKSTPRP